MLPLFEISKQNRTEGYQICNVRWEGLGDKRKIFWDPRSGWEGLGGKKNFLGGSKLGWEGLGEMKKRFGTPKPAKILRWEGLGAKNFKKSLFLKCKIDTFQPRNINNLQQMKNNYSKFI